MKPAALALAAALALGGCASSAAPAPAVQAGASERIEMEVRSWGRLVSHWSITADGKAVQTRPEPDTFSARELVTRRFDIGAKGFAEIRTLLADAEKRAGQKLPCEQRMTDLPYGKILWSHGSAAPAQLDFDSGCRDAPTQPVLDALQAADNRVAESAKAATDVQRGPVPEE